MEHSIKISAPEGKIPVYNEETRTVTFIDEDITARVKSYKDALEVLGEREPSNLYTFNEHIIAKIKCDTIIRALNLGHKFSLTEGKFYYPYLVYYLWSSVDKQYKTGEYPTFKCEGTKYVLVGGGASYSGLAGLGYFDFFYSVGYSRTYVGYACKDYDTAVYFSKQFAKLFFDSLYAENLDYSWQ